MSDVPNYSCSSATRASTQLNANSNVGLDQSVLVVEHDSVVLSLLGESKLNRDVGLQKINVHTPGAAPRSK